MIDFGNRTSIDLIRLAQNLPKMRAKAHLVCQVLALIFASVPENVRQVIVEAWAELQLVSHLS